MIEDLTCITIAAVDGVCTGGGLELTLITVKAIHELHRIRGRYALVTMCIGGGQGIAAIFERT
jgi:hypothetical protein